MSPNHGKFSKMGPQVSRRRFLGAAGVVIGVTTAGCSTLGSSSQSEGEGDTIEILVSNQTSEPVQIAVRIEDDIGNRLFSRVYDIEPGKMDQSAGINTRPSTVCVFAPNGASAEWDYAPGADFPCDGADIGIRLNQERVFERWYDC